MIQIKTNIFLIRSGIMYKIEIFKCIVAVKVGVIND